MLHLLPHTHADVGWLQTVDSLSRMNVSRILDGVVGNLMNDTLQRRRFVWDEMAFLQAWWDGQATAAQQKAFTGLVHAGRIELVDNGWSQHDMGCTTADSMINNWLTGHQWIKDKFGSAARPKVGWSLDPFGLSTTQAVLQALAGMEAWFFTRVSDPVVEKMKASKALEFVWRASSSLLDADAEIFCHVYESYYCMPLPTYAFEWGPDKGAVIPNASNVRYLAQGLANITKQRAQWFRTENVLIPWGCDYHYQDASLTYRSTDMLIDYINSHTAEWGVHARYSTPSEYLASIRAATNRSEANPKTPKAHGPITFPVKHAGTSFFPYNGWSGFFTSRPVLKGLSRQTHAALHAAESLYALHGRKARDGLSAGMWGLLEEARRNAGIIQHHDAITGTECMSEEGCAWAASQSIGPHNVVGDYESMLHTAIANANSVAAQSVAEMQRQRGEAPGSLSADPSVLGKLLMGNGNGGEIGRITVFNPLASVRTEIVGVQVPVCAVTVLDMDTGQPVASQVTAMTTIDDGQAPFYDYALHFEAKGLTPLGTRMFVINPAPDGKCGGDDLSDLSRSPDNTKRPQPQRAAFFVEHASVFARVEHPGAGADAATHGIVATPETVAAAVAAGGGLGLLSGDPRAWSRALQLSRQQGALPARRTDGPEQSRSRVNHTQAAAPAVVVLENTFLKVSVDPAVGVASVVDKRSGRSFNLTHTLVAYKTSASDAYGFEPTGMATPVTAGLAGGKVVAATVAKGPIMHEVRFQVTYEHKTRIRIWQSEDPEVGRRIEFGNRIGVLLPNTDLVSRFESTHLAGHGATFYSEDNGYEAISHTPGVAGGANAAGQTIADQYFPSQMSAYLANNVTGAQLSVALDRSHAVGSLVDGTLDVVQHRRGGLPPFEPGVLLDDTTRIFTDTWLAIGSVADSERMRVAMKMRLNHPLLLLFGPDAPAESETSPTPPAPPAPAPPVPPKPEGLPSGIHLQSLRAMGPKPSDQILIRLQHLWAAGTLGANVSTVDLVSLFHGITMSGVSEVTLTAMAPRSDAADERQHFATGSEVLEPDGSTSNRTQHPRTATNAEDASDELGTRQREQQHSRILSNASVAMRPFEIRTFLANELF